MYLTRLFLDPTSRAARADATDPTRLHKTVMSLFETGQASDARRQLGIMHRLDESSTGRLLLLVQSAQAPDPRRVRPGYLLDVSKDLDLAEAGIVENPSTRDVTAERAAIAVGDVFAFRLKANTTRRIMTKTGADGVKRNGKRVPVRGDENRIAWLKRHADAAGFRFTDLRVTEVAAAGKIGEVRLAGAMFEGVLEVEVVDRFREALARGIGPGKAFGFGLLSIRRR